MAGHLQKRCASLLEAEEERDLDAVVDSYWRASNYFLAANLSDQSRCVLERAARLLGGQEIGRYLDAARMYASVGVDLIETSNLTKRSAGRAFFRAGLLYLAAAAAAPASGSDECLAELKGKMKGFRDVNYLFKTSREHAFLERTMDAIRSMDLTGFADHVYHYDTICELDTWCLDLLDRVRLSLSK